MIFTKVRYALDGASLPTHDKLKHIGHVLDKTPSVDRIRAKNLLPIGSVKTATPTRETLFNLCRVISSFL